jgi:Mn-dependent DtxR family transcriptional regulator
MVTAAGQSDVPSLANIRRNDSASVQGRIRRYVEDAVRNCGSAAALARTLAVKPPTVSQWRRGLKKPGAVNLVRIQNLITNARGRRSDQQRQDKQG